MIQPINGHLLIEPVKHDSFMASQRETFEEIGLVIARDEVFANALKNNPNMPAIGDKVYFDGWLAAKFPNGDDSWHWLVKYDDLRAIDNEAISEL